MIRLTRRITGKLKTASFMLAGVAAAGMLPACGGSDDDGANADALHGGGAKTWRIIGAATNGEADEVEPCRLDDAYVFKAAGAVYEVVEGAKKCPVFGGEPDSLLESGGYEFNAGENFLVVENVLYGMDHLGLYSDTLRIAELTADRLVLYDEYATQGVERRVEVTLEAR